METVEIIEEKEDALDKLITTLQSDIENRTNTFTARDVAQFSGSIPELTTMLEFRQKREKYIEQFDELNPKIVHNFYFEELIKKCKVLEFSTCDSTQELQEFFKKEITRVKKYRDQVQNNIFNVCLFIKTQPVFGTFMKIISKHLAAYETSLAKISSKNASTFEYVDFLPFLQHDVVKHIRKKPSKLLCNEAKILPLTERHSIITNCFNRIEKDLLTTRAQRLPPVPFLLNKSAQLDAELLRLAQRFDVDTDFNADDGQLFLYVCDKKYNYMFAIISNLEYKKIPSQYTYDRPLNKDTSTIIDQVLVEQVPFDDRISNLFNLIEDDDELSITNYIKDNVAAYNQLVGLMKTGKLSNGLLKRKELLATDKLACWFKLRLLHCKFLRCAILSHLNLFEAFRQNLLSDEKYTWCQNKKLPQLFEIKKNNELVFFKNAEKEFELIKNNIIELASHFAVTYETSITDTDRNRHKIVNREMIIEQLLEYEFKFINAKRKLIQALYETTIHRRSKKVVHQIFEILTERPKFRLSQYNYFDQQYKLAIDLLEKKASIIRTILNLQIIYERKLDLELPDSIPAFDKPSILKNVHQNRIFCESIPISPFEIYQYIVFIGKFLTILKEVTIELCESIDMKTVHFFEYMELSVWNQFGDKLQQFTSNGYYPFDMQNYPFKCDVSDSISSMVIAKCFNDINYIIDFINSCPSHHRLRFIMSYKKFLDICWKIQEKVYVTDSLQSVYIRQGLTINMGDIRLHLQPFKDIAGSELLDANDQMMNEKLLDFALNDFEPCEFDFKNKEKLYKLIKDNDFTKMEKILQFQKVQVFALNVAVRYNFFVIDNDFLVSHFGLDAKEDVDVFLTQADDMDDENEETNNAFVRQFMAADLLYDSKALLINNKKSKEKFEYFYVNIRSMKAQTRTVLNAHFKQNIISEIDLYKLYVDEIIEAFSAPAYRLEVAFVCRLERQLLLSNNFVDSFVLESSKILLVNEAGRIQNHFVVPAWSDTFNLVRTAPYPRQASIFKTVLNHVVSLYHIVHLVRFEVSLSQKKASAFESIWKDDFHLETPILQKLFNELGRLPGGNEFDVSSKYLDGKLQLLLNRLELAIYQAYEVSFVSVSGSEHTLAKVMLTFHKEIIDSGKNKTTCFISSRFIPSWCNHFLGDTSELNRNELSRQLLIVDQKIDDILVFNQLHSVLESSQSLVASLDFIAIALHQYRIKFLLFQLSAGKSPEQIKDPFMELDTKSYMLSLNQWNENIVPKAYKALAPKEESIVAFNDKPISETKLIQVQSSIAQEQCDVILVSQQLESMKKLVDTCNSEFSHSVHKISKIPPSCESRPLLENPNDVERFFKAEFDTCRYLIISELVKGIQEIKAGNVIESRYLESLTIQMSQCLNNFIEQSVGFLSDSWLIVLLPYLNLARTTIEDVHLLDLTSRMLKDRFTDHVKSDTAMKLQDYLFEINQLDAQIQERKQKLASEEIEANSRINNEFKILVSDLRDQKRVMKNIFTLKRKFAFDIILKRIDKASKVKFEKTGLVYGKAKETAEFDDKQWKSDIFLLKEKVKKLRILRCLSSIASRRFYTKRIQSYEVDRKAERARLWEAKRDFESIQTQMLDQLQTAYRRLGDAELDIEKLKQQLENEKQSTIQLVHWKALNVKKEELIQTELRKLDGVDNINVGKLVDDLKKAKETLAHLVEETEFIELETERSIRKPMKQADTIRRQMKTSQIQKTQIIRGMSRPQTARAGTKDMLIEQYTEENIQIRSRNDTLLQQLQQLEEARSSIATSTQNIMDDVKASAAPGSKRPPVPRIKLGTSKAKPKSSRREITRPKTAMTPRKQTTDLAIKIDKF